MEISASEMGSIVRISRTFPENCLQIGEADSGAVKVKKIIRKIIRARKLRLETIGALTEF